MSRRFCFSISLSFFFSILFAVPAVADPGLAKGLIAGWGPSDWEFQPAAGEDTFESKNGFCAGAYLGGTMSGQFGWRGEVLFTRKGARSVNRAIDENGNDLGDLETEYNVDYLEVPLLVTWTFPLAGAVRPVIQFGPAIDFELSARKETSYPSGIQLPFNDDGDIQTAGSTDFSLVVAGGIDIDAGGKVVNLQVRYVMGQLEVYRTFKNKTLTFMAGFGI
ncbi:MAG: outer membrane beta-barrel protein [Candidatus Krumholzibacteriota bacterium]